MAVFGRENPLAGKKEVTPQELLSEQLRCISNGLTELSGRRADWYARLLGKVPTRVKMADDTDTIDMLVSGGFGYTLLNDSLKDTYNRDQYVYIPIRGVKERRSIWLVWRRGNENPVLKRFLETIEDPMQ